jgi:hypothetical protein
LCGVFPVGFLFAIAFVFYVLAASVVILLCILSRYFTLHFEHGHADIWPGVLPFLNVFISLYSTFGHSFSLSGLMGGEIKVG